jgi:two-component system, chemotaxis family, response regulator Rcp1
MSTLKILAVEDNPSDIFVLRRALKALDENCELEVLMDGEKALEFVRAQRESQHEPHPCVILLDLHLPKHNGIEILQAIRHEPVLNHIHVVVLTTIASPQEEKELNRMGADLRLKPNNLAGFSTLAAELIEICKGLIPA